MAPSQKYRGNEFICRDHERLVTQAHPPVLKLLSLMQKFLSGYLLHLGELSFTIV